MGAHLEQRIGHELLRPLPMVHEPLAAREKRRLDPQPAQRIGDFALVSGDFVAFSQRSKVSATSRSPRGSLTERIDPRVRGHRGQRHAALARLDRAVVRGAADRPLAWASRQGTGVQHCPPGASAMLASPL